MALDWMRRRFFGWAQRSFTSFKCLGISGGCGISRDNVRRKWHPISTIWRQCDWHHLGWWINHVANVPAAKTIINNARLSILGRCDGPRLMVKLDAPLISWYFKVTKHDCYSHEVHSSASPVWKFKHDKFVDSIRNLSETSRKISMLESNA